MPRVKQFTKEIFGKNPSTAVNPDLVVAVGAAIQGGVLSGSVNDVVLVDVTPLSLGIELQHGDFAVIIPKNTAIPARKSKNFTTVQDNQSTINVVVYQGDRAMARDNKMLGNFLVQGLPPCKAGLPSVEVAFDIDVNGIVKVTAQEKRGLGGGKEFGIQVQSSSGLSKEEIERMQRDAEIHAEDDKRKREQARLRNEIETATRNAESSLNEYSGQISDQLKTEIWNKIQALKDQSDSESLEKRLEDLNKTLGKIGEEIYAKNNPNAGSEEKSN